MLQYFYAQIDNNQMQRELYNDMFGSSLQTQRLAELLAPL